VSAEPLRLAFGNAAADYERRRAEWPDAVAEVGGVPPEAEVLDLGAGTGKLTRVLVRRFARVTAVEPNASMRALCSQVTDCYLEGSAEAIPLADGSVDAVFCGDAFHWFDWPVALGEVVRVLRPRGALVLAWNNPADGRQFPPEVWKVIHRYRRPGIEPGGPIYQSGIWREPFAGSPFEPLTRTAIEHELVQDLDGVIAETLSVSVFAWLPPEERVALAAELRAAVPDVTYRTSYRADVWWTRLR
jgi:SAM-dependent methyltransferase